MTPIRLNLACGTDIRDDWSNLDVVKKWPLARRACDVLWDARKDAIPFSDDSVSEVYAGYLFLHLAPRHHTRVLRDIRRTMKPGARLVVGEVDMAELLPRWLSNPGNHYLSGLIWGEQGDLPVQIKEQEDLESFDKHNQGFTEGSLRDFLRSEGFMNSRRISVHDKNVWYELTLETFK